MELEELARVDGTSGSVLKDKGEVRSLIESVSWLDRKLMLEL